MSNEITAYFKGRAGVAESVYQYDYGKILVIDGLNLPAVFEVHFANTGDDDAITVIGQNNRAAIPNACLTATGIVTAYIYLHEGDNDGETEYIVRFAVTQRARPAYDSTAEERSDFESAVQQAIAMLQNPKKVNTPLNAHNQVNNGTAGQLLRTKGNGATEWVDEGLPTDAQTAAAVAAWLDDHPEATTTVEDASLTEAKFTDELKLKTLKDYVTPEMFGAIGDGTTDDTAALQEAFLHPFVRIPHKTYKITDSLTVKSNTIIAADAKIYASYNAWKKAVLDFETLDYIDVRGLSIDANDMASFCFYVGVDTVSAKLDSVVFENCNATNTNNKSSQTNSAGIFLYRDHDNSCVKGCSVSNVNRESANSGYIASVGIHVSHILGVCDISNNAINGVYYQNGNPYDADGIHVFSKNSGTNNAENTAINVSNNVIINCQGRFIKVQGENARIIGNTCKIYDLELMANFTGIDLQTAGGYVMNNSITMLDWTGGAEAHYITSTGRDYTMLQCTAKIYGNYFYSNVQLYAGIIIGCAPTVTTIINITDNRIANASTMLYITGNASMTAMAYVIYTNNAVGNYTNSSIIDSNIQSHVEIIKNNNIGSLEANLNMRDLVVPNTVTTIKDFLSDIYSQISSLGIVVGTAIWTGTGSFTYIFNRMSTTRADVIVYYNAHVYRMYHHANDDIYYFDFEGSSMS